MLATNPSSSKSADTSTEKEAAMEFPEDVTFPIVAKVMVNFYKRAETIDNEIVYKPVVKKLKYEIMMNKEDFASKKAFEGAVVRETDATKLAAAFGQIWVPKKSGDYNIFAVDWGFRNFL